MFEPETPRLGYFMAVYSTRQSPTIPEIRNPDLSTASTLAAVPLPLLTSVLRSPQTEKCSSKQARRSTTNWQRQKLSPHSFKERERNWLLYCQQGPPKLRNWPHQNSKKVPWREMLASTEILRSKQDTMHRLCRTDKPMDIPQESLARSDWRRHPFCCQLDNLKQRTLEIFNNSPIMYTIERRTYFFCKFRQARKPPCEEEKDKKFRTSRQLLVCVVARWV